CRKITVTKIFSSILIMLLINFLRKASVISIVAKWGLSLMLFLFLKLKMRQTLLILMFFFVISSNGQNSGQYSSNTLLKADSVQILKFQKQLKTANDKEELDLNYKLATIYLSKNDSIANKYIDLLLQNAATANEVLYKARALFLKGKIISLSSSIRALDYFQDATKFLEDSEDQCLKDVYYEQSQIHTLFSEFPMALDFGLKSLEFNEINHIEENVLRDMSFIGYIYDRMYEFRESIKW